VTDEHQSGGRRIIGRRTRELTGQIAGRDQAGWWTPHWRPVVPKPITSAEATQLLSEQRRKLRTYAASIVEYWNQVPATASVPKTVREAMTGLAAKLEGSDSALLRAVERVVRAATPSVRSEALWATDAIRALVPALNSLARQLRRSQLGQEVLQLCRDVRENFGGREIATDRDHKRFMAAVMVIEDATCAIEGYRALPPFAHTDEAYLAKYGLLQALQLGFDAVERVGEVLGVRLRADAASGGKRIKITRTLVAGHPLGGNMRGQAWEHFHDRGSASDKSVMKIMSFASDNTDNWTGQTQSTTDLMDDGLVVIRNALHQIIKKARPSDQG
jgi:hypothetical protein